MQRAVLLALPLHNDVSPVCTTRIAPGPLLAPSRRLSQLDKMVIAIV